MSVLVVTPPSEPLIDLAVAKAHLRVEHDDHDDLIQAHLAACAEWLDGPTGILGRALGAQTLRAIGLWRSACGGFQLPIGPVQSVSAVTYRDGLGAEVDMDAAVYELEDGANRVRLAAGEAWPMALRGPVSITYVAGYAPDGMPANIQSAVLLHLNILYDQPDEKTQVALERARDALLAPLRKRRV